MSLIDYFKKWSTFKPKITIEFYPYIKLRRQTMKELQPYEKGMDEFLNSIEQGLNDDTPRPNKRSPLETINSLANTINAVVDSSSNLVSSVQGIFQLEAEIAKINSETTLRIAELQKSYSEFIKKEENKKETLFKMLEIVKEQNNRILDKAMDIDLSKCSEQEYAYVMHVMDMTERFLDRIMNMFDKYITNR